MTQASTVTALDSNVLLDLVTPGAPHALESRDRLNRAALGVLVVTDVVLAEISGAFPNAEVFDQFVTGSKLQRLPLSLASTRVAGLAWREYTRRRPDGLQCPRCGAVTRAACESCGEVLTARQHVVADFLIGAHALEHADQLLTRDRGFYAAYFPDLALA